MPALTRANALSVVELVLLIVAPSHVHAFADEYSEHLVGGVVVGILHPGPGKQLVTDLGQPAARMRLTSVEWLSLQHHVVEPDEVRALAALPILRR
ncbi:MAG: hypothetical protein KDA96_21800, partial [Planctomycetaceae bacterium]|nr:hypothetical protein [Planctomycetaceae bacterium]